MEFKCNCHNSGTNSYTGKCSNCGMIKSSQGTIVTLNSTPMEKFKTLHENKNDLEQFYSKSTLEDIKSKVEPLIYTLDRVTILENKELIEDLDGEYVLFSSVLNLFAPKNK